MRTRLFALATLASALLVASAHAGDDDDPAEEPAPSTTATLPPLPPLAVLPDLPPLPALPPLALPSAPSPTLPPTPSLAPAPTPSLAPALPPSAAMLSVSSAPAAVLGQYDEYKRPINAYAIDRDPVSVGAYERCTAAGKCTKPSCSGPPGGDGRVTCVDLVQAEAYCDFAGARLPTEDEWEHAARTAGAIGLRSIDDAAEWTSSPYCFFCGKDDQVVRGGPARNPALRGWRPPATHDPGLGFRCATGG